MSHVGLQYTKIMFKILLKEMGKSPLVLLRKNKNNILNSLCLTKKSGNDYTVIKWGLTHLGP